LYFADLDLVSVDFDGARGTASKSSTANGCLSHGFGGPGGRSVFLGDTDSFTYAAATYRRAFQKFESALDWSGSDGWSGLGYCD
jgi:hypothetical protein